MEPVAHLVDGDGARSGSGRRRDLLLRSPAGVGLLGGAVTFVVLVLASLDLLSSHLVEDGDFAANSILIDRALRGRLLVGNYSRLGFHHPGPAILDIQALGEAVFHRLLGVVPTAFGGQFLGILLLNATCIGLAVAVAFRALRSAPAALSLLPMVLLIPRWEASALTSTWMPHTYIAPFLLLCIAGGAVAAGSWADLRHLMLAAGLTVHGHVSFVLFATITVALAVTSGWRVTRSGRGAGEKDPGRLRLRRDLLWAAAVAALFAAPFLVNLALHWPGELERYRTYASDKQGFLPRSAGDVARFVRGYLAPSGWWMLPVLVLAGAVALRRASSWSTAGRRFVVGALVVVGLETVLMTVYAVRGVDDLSQTYVGLFALTLPVIVLWMGVATVIGPAADPDRRAGLNWILVAALLGVAVIGGSFSNPYRGIADVVGVERALGPGPVRLRFSTQGWPKSLGVVEDLRRRGRPVCVVGREWAFLVTSEMICPAVGAGRNMGILGPSEPVPADSTVRLRRRDLVVVDLR